MISLNADTTSFPQPTNVNEKYFYSESKKRSLSGLQLRNRRGKTKIATLAFKHLTPSEYQFLEGLTEVDDVAYANPDSKHGTWNFDGQATMQDDGDYHKGTGLYSDVVMLFEE